MDQALRQHRHLRGAHPQPTGRKPAVSSGTRPGNVHFWRRMDVPRRQHRFGRLRQHRGRELGHLANQTLDVKNGGAQRPGRTFLLVQNSSVDVSHPFQVAPTPTASPRTQKGCGDFGWSTCIGSNVYGGFGQVAVEFDSCVQHEGTCASNLDAVGRYVVGNHAGYVEATRTVNLIDNAPPTFTAVPDDLELECPADPYGVPLSTVPMAVDDFQDGCWTARCMWCPGRAPNFAC